MQLATIQNNDGLLIGFVGEYALDDDANPVTIIVLFESNPADVQLYEAKKRGEALSLSIAENNVKDDHEGFLAELAELFGETGKAYGQTYTINWEYRRAINGVSITIPSDTVQYISQFNSVRAGFPNIRVRIDIPDVTQDVIDSIFKTSHGMSPGRAAMQADDMHVLGYRGAGVTIAVFDTGIDYNHPAFNSAFLTLEEMRLKNADITEKDTINRIF